MKNAASLLLERALKASGLSLREIARRAGTSHATLIAYRNGVKCPSVDTLERIIAACDLAFDVSLRPRIRRSHGLTRGEELVQVLRLAEQFPAKPARRPDYPRFPRHPA